MDQAGTLRKIMSQRPNVRSTSAKSMQVISVTSGKGGVGKTNVVANLAVSLQKAGHRVLVLDGDFGLANLNIVMGLESKGTVHDVIRGESDIHDIVLEGPQGLALLPASSGLLSANGLSLADRSILMDKLESFQNPFDILLIDTGAGINSDVVYLNSAARQVVVVTTPEPTSIADAYALMKVMSQQHGVKKFKLLVNMTNDSKDGLNVYNHILDVADRFLNISIDYIGSVPFDRRISQSVMSRQVFCEQFPNTVAASSIEKISQYLIEKGTTDSSLTGNLQFFWRTMLMSEVHA